MTLPKRYDASLTERRLKDSWREEGTYHFYRDSAKPIYSIDTPPPTVSGKLHLGHVYSYSHTDFLARFWRMRGREVFYPMGFDDNGLPTERLVESKLGRRAAEIERGDFIEQCMRESQSAEEEYRSLWQRLGLSIDWRYTYRTIDDRSRKIAQWSFIDLLRKDLVYQRQAPTIWCPECQTSIAQAELNDLERQSEFFTLDFKLENGQTLPIATTRPELLPACVAIFVHPGDARYQGLVGHKAQVPLFSQWVPILEDPAADPEKGTGAVMCCTFGDVTDVAWWYTHHLPVIELVKRDGRLAEPAGEFSGMRLAEARQQIVERLRLAGLILDRQPTEQSIRVHERCDTPIEFIVTRQWFIRVLDFKQQLLEAGDQIRWFPSQMKARYTAWVENLNWDWCISRQRFFGVPFPLWYCARCHAPIPAEEDQLPVDPRLDAPRHPCPQCGGQDFIPEEDIFDTWMTSSMSPQIVGGWDSSDAQQKSLYPRVFPFSLRPQAHEIIRTWAFYTIVKSKFHFDQLPWSDAAISGWGIAGEGMGKISKSRGGGPMPPMEMIERYSADAVRYWAASTGPGKDAIISEEKIQLGARLVTKLWNVARFSERFLEGYQPPQLPPGPLSTADRWILARLQSLIRRVTSLLESYDYAAAKNEVETFFWGDLTDNYLEMSKQRLYNGSDLDRSGARFSLYYVLLNLLKLFAPFLPYITEAIYQGLFQAQAGSPSIHRTSWPEVEPILEDSQAEQAGALLVQLATCVRRYKSERNLPLGSELLRLQLATVEPELVQALELARQDLSSITRAQIIDVAAQPEPGLEIIADLGQVKIAIEP